MEITEVKVFPINEEKLKAFASVVFDGCFMVNDIKVIRGREGLFISMPSRKKKNGEFKDVAHPLNNDTRRMIEGHVLGEYERILAERQTSREERAEPEPARPLQPEASRDGAGAAAPPPQPSQAPAAPVAVAAAAAVEPPPTEPPRTEPPRTEPPRTEPPQTLPQEARAPETAASEEPSPEVNTAPETAAPVPPEAEPEEKTLEEVQELHLRDSFWTVT